MKYLPHILTISFFLLAACGKEDPVIPPPDPSGHYAGQTNEHDEWANSLEGYNERDSLYLDTFQIQLLGEDSIVFIHQAVQWQFPVDSSHIYTEWYGTHSNRTFEWKEPDSLLVRYWYYGGYGTSYNSGTVHFSGKIL